MRLLLMLLRADVCFFVFGAKGLQSAQEEREREKGARAGHKNSENTGSTCEKKAGQARQEAGQNRQKFLSVCPSVRWWLRVCVSLSVCLRLSVAPCLRVCVAV